MAKEQSQTGVGQGIERQAQPDGPCDTGRNPERQASSHQAGPPQDRTLQDKEDRKHPAAGLIAAKYAA